MKKILTAVLAAVLVIGTCSIVPAYAKSSQTEAQSQKNKITINGRSLEVPGGVIEVQGEKLYPLRWMAEQMGAEVKWDQENRTAIVSNNLYQKAHLYLSYLGALIYNNENETEYALPKRIEALKLPAAYPLSSENGKMLHEKPVGITISDEGFQMEYVAYDYEISDGRLYVSANWFNTIFLAQTEQSAEGISLNYPEEDEINQKLGEIEEVLAPVTPEETLALWIKGQQIRSGALQYSSLSPELKNQVLAAKRSWVTGGSSPSAGKAVIIKKQALNDDTYVYDLEIEELLEGKASAKAKQQLKISRYQMDEKAYWLISSASGDLDFFTLLD